MKEVTPGILMLGPYGPYRNACWVLYRDDEAAVVEMPPYRRSETRPWRAVEKVLRQRGLWLKYAFLSHAHRDHCQSIMDFRKAFPDTEFVGHRSFMSSRLLAYQGFTFDTYFSRRDWSGTLGGEHVHLIHAPKHSETDLLLLFRGAMLTGDWYLGDLKDCNALVRPAEKIRSIKAVQKLVRRWRYHVHMMFSAHGDCLYYNVDFERMMELSKIDHPLEAAR